MCLAIPGRITEILDQQWALVDFEGVQKEINLSLVAAQKGDFVIVHAGFAIEKMDENEARAVFEAYEK